MYSTPRRDRGEGRGNVRSTGYRFRSSIITGIQNRDHSYKHSQNGLIIVLFYPLFMSRRFLHDKMNMEKLIILLFYVYF